MKIGDKVVYIGNVAAGLEPTTPEILSQYRFKQPEVGKVYVIEKVLHGTPKGLALVGGYSSWRIDTGAEGGFDLRLFRLLDEVKAENKAKATRKDT